MQKQEIETGAELGFARHKAGSGPPRVTKATVIVIDPDDEQLPDDLDWQDRRNLDAGNATPVLLEGEDGERFVGTSRQLHGDYEECVERREEYEEDRRRRREYREKLREETERLKEELADVLDEDSKYAFSGYRGNVELKNSQVERLLELARKGLEAEREDSDE